jgi:hypothetical protein
VSTDRLLLQILASSLLPNPKTGERRSLRKVAAELAKIGWALADAGTPGAEQTARTYFARDGQPYSAKGV